MKYRRVFVRHGWWVVVFLICSYILYPLALAVGERILYALVPSQERAVRYGNRHFNAQFPRVYDFELAMDFFQKAASFDIPHSHLQHQLARIAFLRGDYRAAIFHINKQINDYGEDLPNSYYMRGLIKGYMGLYDSAAEDYEVFLKHSPNNWAGITDYSWVLLKAERFADAAKATEGGLVIFPDNAWLLNTNAIALFELGEYDRALESARRGVGAADKLTKREWLMAYPGNDPRVADEGLATLRKSARDNMHTIEMAIASSTVQ